ncbi:hypothetical protein ACFVT2_35885 [Streptomyces sp. NPDC058000]|uniref:hypothetical protein n=1 Tax=Streptomyces sp. NPDC058000 TaxID=3346299 RepID=UPI0036ED7429
MQVARIVQAALVALAVSGVASVGSAAYAEGGGDGHGASVHGGFTGVGLSQQNTAQAHRQNNNCFQHNRLFGQPALTGSRPVSHCVTADASINKHAVVVGRGAHAVGGSSTVTELAQQNTAQRGRQNNNCGHVSASQLVVTGGLVHSHCADLDRSRNKHTLVKGGGARTAGGSGVIGDTFQENAAQEGRQNNNCADSNSSILTVIGGRLAGRCANVDRSRNKGTVVKSGGADAEGGSSVANFADNQNTAQDGRQNNSCGNPSDTTLKVTGSRVAGRCANVDGSRNKHSVFKSRGAHAEGGSATGAVSQQTTAQTGRQNNSCAEPEDSTLNLTGALAQSSCTNVDRSRNKHHLVRRGGAETEGGTSLTAALNQQTTAQTGQQNNNCARANDTTITLTGSRARSRCATVDRSVNAGGADVSGGAETEGGSGLAAVNQQNTAQDGSQNNNCSNPNALNLSLSGSRSRTQCVAVDESKNIHSVYR